MASKLVKSFVISVFSFGLLFGFSAPKAQTTEAVDDSALLIQQAISAKDFAKAEDLLAKTEDLPEVQKDYLQGWLSLQKGEEAEALAKWQALHQANPEFLELGNNLAALLIKNGEYDQAKEVLEKSLHADARVSKALNNLRQLYAYQAQQAYQKVFKSLDTQKPKAQFLALSEATVISVKSNDFSEQQEILDALEAWRAAWSRKSVEGYLAAYAEDFVPANGQSLNAWKASRTRSLKGPKYIEILLSNLELTPLDEDIVRVKFVQRYKSDRYSDQVVKVMLFTQTSAGWKITQEVTVDEIK